MATYFPPKKNTAFIIYVALESVATAGAFQANPTLASGDFKVSIDGGTLNNLTTLPTVTPASGRMVKISLSSSEMNGDNITIVCSDASGGEWKDLVFNMQTVANQIDDLATPTNITAGTITTATNVTTVNGLASGVITAASIAADAITAAKIADGAIDAATFAAGAINAAAIATDAIGAAEIAADAVTKIQNGLATPTNITAGTITTATNVTNGVTLANGAITAAVIATDAIDADAIAASAVSEIQSGLATLAGLFGYDMESGKTFAQAVLDIWATRVGDASANSATAPTSITYDSPDGTVQVTHTHSTTSRTLA